MSRESWTEGAGDKMRTFRVTSKEASPIPETVHLQTTNNTMAKNQFLYSDMDLRDIGVRDYSREMFLDSVDEDNTDMSGVAALNASQSTLSGHPDIEIAFNWSHLEKVLGPRRQDLWTVILITIIYCIIFVFGIIGNTTTCIVIARNRFMQTATNIYLFNLAVSDLLMLILGLPQETYIYWSAYPYIFGETFCLVRTMAAETSTNASILTITAFTVERYIAICHPMRSQTLSSIRRAVKVIVAIWVVSGLCSIPMVVQFGIVYVRDDNDDIIPQSAACSIKTDYDYFKYAFEISSFMFFLTPMTVITVLYVLIGMAIRRSALNRTGSDSSYNSDTTGSELRAQQQARARRAVLKMLVAVVVAFFICWGPFHAQRLMVIYLEHDQWTKEFRAFANVFFQTSGVLYYVISVVNPILYNVMSLKFRQAFKNTIFRSCHRTKTRKPKPKVLRTYRFCNHRFAADTNLTLIRANGFAALLRAKKPAHEIQYIGARSRSSSHSGSGVPVGQLNIVGIGHTSSDLEIPLRKDEISGCHSYHCQPRVSTSVVLEHRQYHSYA